MAIEVDVLSFGGFDFWFFILCWWYFRSIRNRIESQNIILEEQNKIFENLSEELKKRG